MNEEDRHDWMPSEEPLVSGLFGASYEGDSGTGVEFFVHSNEVYVAVSWDGECRQLLHLTSDELDEIVAAAKAE